MFLEEIISGKYLQTFPCVRYAPTYRDSKIANENAIK